MAPPKRYWARLKLPTEFLKTLPDFPTPISKSRLKRLAAEERRALLASSLSNSNSANVSKAGSPSPSISESMASINDADSIDIDNDIAMGDTPSNELETKHNGGNSALALANQQHSKINTGVKEFSTAGLKVNSDRSSLYAIDRSGKDAKSWYRGIRQFKTFSGYKVTYTTYRNNKVKAEPTQNTQEDSNPASSTLAEQNSNRATPESTAAATPVN